MQRAGVGRECRLSPNGQGAACSWRRSSSVLDDAHEQLCGDRREGTEGPRTEGHHDGSVCHRAPSNVFRALFYFAGTSVVLGSWWGLASIPIFALLLSIRIGIEEKTLRLGLEGYADYAACRVRSRLIPLIW
ncbi:MAG TPA: hypothetical protein VFB43_16285 [Terracidiphilus sp.]|nr:hypothetical protein [Terracidiphilus sp.]